MVEHCRQGDGHDLPVVPKNKNWIVKATCENMAKLEKVAGKPVQHLCQDNVIENKSIEKRMGSEVWQMTTKVEYTARGTPQKNSYAELSFTVLSVRGRVAMNLACIPIEKRCYWFPECIVTTAKLHWLGVIEINRVKGHMHQKSSRQHPAICTTFVHLRRR